jgi:phosphatidate phosphatase APP1
MYPTAAYWEETDQRWILPIHGWLYHDEPGFRLKFSQIWNRQDNALLASALQSIHDSDRQAVHTRFQQRARKFLNGNRPGEQVTITVDQTTKDVFHKSTTGGHFYSIFGLKYEEHEIINAVDDQNLLHYQCFVKTNDQDRCPGVSLFLPPKGFSVIIDLDAVLHTPFTDRKKLLSSLFLEEYRFAAVPGLQNLVQRIQQTYGTVAFHYVTYAPWQLYEDYRAFLNAQGFPIGSFHMNTNHVALDHRIELFTYTRRYGNKAKWMRKLIKTCPLRQFICIGDSRGKNPEMFGTLFRQYRKRIHSIFILDNDDHKDSSDASSLNPSVLSNPGLFRNRRFGRAFRRVPAGMVQIFQNPDDAVL